MGGLTTLLTRNCDQVAVYWGNPQNDGQGGFTFSDPVEILCRWEDMHQVVTDNKGNEITSRALVFTLQDVDEEGYLYLGTLDSLYDNYATDSSAGEIINPKDIPEAYIIKRFQKTPSLDGNDFLKKAYLTPSLSFGGF